MRKFLGILAFVCCAIWLVACGPDQVSQSDVTLNVGLVGEPDTLDPQKSTSVQGQQVLIDMYEGLLRYSSDGELEGGVARDWDVADDGLSYTFYLHQDAQWSNGDPVTAHDFVFSFRRLVSPESGSFYASFISMIENAPAILAGDAAPQELGVAATNDHMLEIRLANPTPYFPQLLTHPATAPLHRETIERFADRATRPEHSVSNGAYRIVRYDIASLIVLDKNPHYRESDTVKIDQVFYHAIVSDAAMYNRYRAGDLDITFSIPSGSYQSIMAERPTELKIAPQLGVYYYGLNLTKPPFKDNPKLRAALSMVIDRETLVEKITGRGELPAYSWVPPGIDGYDPPGFPYQHSDLDARLEIARKLYAEAGFSEENPARFELRFNTGEGESKMALAIQSIWKQSLGAEVTLVNEEFKVLISNIKQMEVTESFRLSWIGDYFDPNTFLELMETGNPQNLTGYSNPRFDKLMSRAASETNSIKRMAILRDAESLMLSDHPVIPLYYYVSKHLVRNEIRGWTNTLVDFHPTRSLWIDRKQK